MQWGCSQWFEVEGLCQKLGEEMVANKFASTIDACGFYSIAIALRPVLTKYILMKRNYYCQVKTGNSGHYNVSTDIISSLTVALPSSDYYAGCTSSNKSGNLSLFFIDLLIPK